MTPEEELKKLNRLIHQYETVYRTTADADQRDRAGHELKQLKSYRDKILAVIVIDGGKLVEQPAAGDGLADFPVLSQLVTGDTEAWEGDQEVRHIALYLGHFEREFLPILTESRLKLDFKHSLERDGFYRRFQEVQRRLDDWHDAHRRLDSGGFNRELEREVRTRISKLERNLAVEACRLFRAVQRFADVLVEDTRGDGVKCLNGSDPISFDRIEGERLLAGMPVTDALQALAGFAAEVAGYLRVPDAEGQENDRADRR
jgi:hypothetical protein